MGCPRAQSGLIPWKETMWPKARRRADGSQHPEPLPARKRMACKDGIYVLHKPNEARSVILFEPEAAAHAIRQVELVRNSSARFENGGFQDEGRNVETVRDTPAENVPKPVP